MEVRTIQKTGGSSFSLTLPKDWIRQYQLKDKDRVVINNQWSGSLIVMPYISKKIITRISLSVDMLSKDIIAREIIAHYVAGTDVIIITAKKLTSEYIHIVRTTVEGLVGFEILDQTTGTITVQNVFDLSRFSILENVAEMFSMVITMQKDIYTAIENRDKNLATDIIERDIDVNKLCLAVTRQFYLLLQNKISEDDIGLGLVDLSYYKNVTVQLERIADHVTKIAKMVVLQSKKTKSVFSRFLRRKAKKLILYLQQIEKTHRLLDNNTAHEIIEYQRLLTKNKHINKYIVEKTSIDIIVEDSIDRIRGYIENIAEEAIDYVALKRQITLKKLSQK